MRKISYAILTAAWCAAMTQTFAMEASPRSVTRTLYRVDTLSSLGGTSSRGNSINDLGLVAGYSKTTGNAVRHASVWALGRQYDLGSLGGPTSNSSVPWPVKNTVGLVSGITEIGGLKLDCGGGLGAAMHVTATFGMVAAARVIERLLAV